MFGRDNDDDGFHCDVLPGDVEEGVGFEDCFDDFFLPFFEDLSRNPCFIISVDLYFIVEWGLYTFRKKCMGSS